MTVLGVELDGALVELREQTLSTMTSTVRVVREDGPSDPLTGVRPVVKIYEGPGKVQVPDQQERTTTVAGHVHTEQRDEIHVPVGAFAAHVGDVIEVVADEHDEYLVGRLYRVVRTLHKTRATAYRLAVSEVTT